MGTDLEADPLAVLHTTLCDKYCSSEVRGHVGLGFSLPQVDASK